MNVTSGIESSTIVSRNVECVADEVDGDLWLTPIGTARVYRFNALGIRVWQLIERPQSVSTMCETLQKEFAVSHEACERDVLDFLNQLSDENLIQTVAPTS